MLLRNLRNLWITLIEAREFDTGVISFQYLLSGPALSRESVGADLAHADAVAPTAPNKYELRNSSRIIILTVDHKQLFTQSQRRSNAAATHMRGAVRPDNLEIRNSM